MFHPNVQSQIKRGIVGIVGHPTVYTGELFPPPLLVCNLRVLVEIGQLAVNFATLAAHDTAVLNFMLVELFVVFRLEVAAPALPGLLCARSLVDLS